MGSKFSKNIDKVFVDACECHFHSLRKKSSQQFDLWSKNVSLYSSDEVPDYIYKNPYVFTGYRCYYTTRQCLKSIFSIHNETMNIWTQLVSLLYSLVMLMCEPWSKCETWIDALIISLRYIGIWFMLITSICFHTMSAHYCYNIASIFGTLDLLGISVLITNASVEAIYLLLYQQSQHFHLMVLYLAIIMALGIATALVTISGMFGSGERAIHRAVFYFIWGISLYLLILNSFELSRNSELFTCDQDALENLHWTAYISTISPLIYATKFPEALFPGKFDIIGRSHQIHHVIIFIAGTYYTNFVTKLRLGRFENTEKTRTLFG